LTPPAGRPIEIAFDDNRRLPLLFGEHNANLTRIERQLGVKLATRGNIVSIAGPAGSAETARTVLAELWRRATSDEPVGPAEIDAALRLKPHAETPASDHPVIRTRRKTIAARTPTQGAYLRAMAQTELVIGTGPAGTGKTYLAVAQAVAALQNGEVGRASSPAPRSRRGNGWASCPATCGRRSIPICARSMTR